MITRSLAKMATLSEVHDLLKILQTEQSKSNKKIDQLLEEIRAKDDKSGGIRGKCKHPEKHC